MSTRALTLTVFHRKLRGSKADFGANTFLQRFTPHRVFFATKLRTSWPFL